MCSLSLLNDIINIFDVFQHVQPIINFDVFQQISTLTQCQPDACTCNCVQRIIECLTYYQTLNVNNTNDQQKMIMFCQQTYQLLLDDYIHIITEHGSDLAQILQFTMTDKERISISCDLINCKVGKRYFRNTQFEPNRDTFPAINIDTDHQFLFYQCLLDSIHCHIYHLYDVGLRINTNAINDAYDTESCIDKQFENICHELNKKQSIKCKNNKFDITGNNDNSLHYTCDQGITFVDGLYQCMLENDVIVGEVEKIKNILEAEQYDSDGIMQDIVDSNAVDSNISMLLPDNYGNQYCLIQLYSQQTKICNNSFDIGYRFYYWPIFKHARSAEEYVKDSQNDNAHSGHLPHELYVRIKYESLKYELLNNGIYTLQLRQYNISLLKANEYLHTSKVRQITAGHGETIWDVLQYNIEQGTNLSLQNLLSVIIYCDWSDLSREFSSTFRKIKPFESLTAVKLRNSEYANWSKCLRETIEYFGKMGWDYAENEEWNVINNRERGPFYCGMSYVMALPQFNIRLCSPTSTTKNIEVATRFGGDRGIIMQLNSGDQINSLFLRCWDCSWLSNFGAENERLFVGGFYTIKIENIRIIETKKNYSRYFASLYYFDCMLTGNMMNESFDSNKILVKHYKIILNLIKFRLSTNDERSCKYPKYIYDTFEAFVNMKSQINLNLEYLDYDFQKLTDLVMYPITTSQYPRKNIFRAKLKNYDSNEFRLSEI